MSSICLCLSVLQFPFHAFLVSLFLSIFVIFFFPTLNCFFMLLKPTSPLNNFTEPFFLMNLVCALSGSSSFESQKMDRPSISVTSPMSPSMLRDAPQYLSGQLSVSDLSMTYRLHVKSSGLRC